MKVFACRKTAPYRRAAAVIVFVTIGTFLGALLLVSTPERVVTIAVIVSSVLAFLLESLRVERFRRARSPVLALASGATSGFSETSGPLKGLAVRALELDRLPAPTSRSSTEHSFLAGRRFGRGVGVI